MFFRRRVFIVLYRNGLTKGQKKHTCVILGVEKTNEGIMPLSRMGRIAKVFYVTKNRTLLFSVGDKSVYRAVKGERIYMAIRLRGEDIILLGEISRFDFLQSPHPKEMGCPKITYQSLTDTMEASENMYKKYKGDWMRPYKCNHCGKWHLTSKPYRYIPYGEFSTSEAVQSG